MNGRRDCTQQLDQIRDGVDRDTVNRELWLSLVTVLRVMCDSLADVHEAVLGDGDSPGTRELLNRMVENQRKRATDGKFSWKRMFAEKVLPTVISSLIITGIAALVAWFVAVNTLISH